MTTISLRREHDLGLEGARRVAAQWADELEKRHGLDCRIEPGEGADTVHFERSGVRGSMRVLPDAFELQAKLGLLAAPFADMIRDKVMAALDERLAGDAGTRRA